MTLDRRLVNTFELQLGRGSFTSVDLPATRCIVRFGSGDSVQTDRVCGEVSELPTIAADPLQMRQLPLKPDRQCVKIPPSRGTACCENL